MNDDRVDIAWRLREQHDNAVLCHEAADEIERLRLNVNLVIAVNRQMRDELQNLAEELRLMSERYE